MRLALVLLGFASACEPLPARSLSEVEFPEGFRLETTQDVVLYVEGSEAWADGRRLLVRSPDARVLFDGGAGLAVRHPLRLRVAAGTKEIVVAVRRGDEVATHRVPVVDQEAVLALGVTRE